MRKRICVLAVFVMEFFAGYMFARTKITGTIEDLNTKEPLIGAAIMVSETLDGAITDPDGCFEIEVSEEETVFEVSYIGYNNLTFAVDFTEDGKIVLKNAEDGAVSVTGTSRLSIFLSPDETVLQNAVVTGKKNLESLQALKNERISSGFAIENMGAKEMSLKGISDAQESVVKMSGISVADAGQLIVRGLGDRYSTTTLNGLPIASPNPDNKLIPLDIFPASTIQNITVSKVYEAASYADYSGAHVDISTKEGAGNDFFKISFSSGGYFNTLGSGFRQMDTPSLFASHRLDAGAENISHQQFASYSKNNEIFNTGFSTTSVPVQPDLNGSAGWGKTLELGTHDLSILATASIKSGDETIRNAFYRTYEASSSAKMMSDYNYDSYTEKLNIAALLNVQYTFRERDNIGFTAFFARNAKTTHLDRTGFDYLETYDLTGRNQVTHFYTLQNYQLAAHHEFGDRWLLDWGASASLTASDEPDRRQVMFRRSEDGTQKFFQLNQQETQRYFGKLGENEVVADVKSTYRFDDKGNRLRFGLSAKYKTRTFRTTRFYYNLRALTEPIPDVDDMSQYINYDNIRSGLISISRTRHKRDRYDAYNAIAAAFVESDLKFGEKWALNAGIRAELSRQSVDYNDDVEDMTRNLDAIDLFPAINLRYDIREGRILRLSLSRTVTRPSFVEMAPFLYQESFGGAQIRGNEFLTNGYNYNVDLKYEFFRDNSDDMFAVTGYLKYLDNPIERTQRVSGGATEHSFQNADNGIAAGVEVELKKRIFRSLFLTANASYMYTDVILPEGGVYTNMQRSLQGASPYLVNADLSYAPEFRNGSSLTLAILYNLQGPRIQSVGILGLGDVIQQPLHSLDFNCVYNINKHFAINISMVNLLDSTVKMVQEVPNADKTVDVERWKLGRGFEIGVSYSL